MENGKRRVALWVVGGLVMTSSSLFAHHSEAMLNKNRLVTLRGTIAEHLLVNPHQLIKLKVTDANGNVTVWRIQGGSVQQYYEIGWKKDTLKPGEEVTVTGYANHDGSPGMCWMRIVKADGTEVPLDRFKKRMLGEYLQLHGHELSNEEYGIYKRSVTTGVGALPDPAKSPKIEADPTKTY